MKKRTTTQYAKALYELTRELKGEKMHEAVTEFVKMLARDHKLKQGTGIVSAFISYAKKMEGTIPLTVVTARKIAEKELIKIGDAISKNSEVTDEVDANILGGVIVKTDEMILDGSIKRQIERLKFALN